MDRNTKSPEPWEELFEPDELPPPRPPVQAAPPAAPKQAPEPKPEPKPGRFERLIQQPSTPSASSPQQPAKPEPPASFLGEVPRASDPESTGSIRRAKRPRRDS